MNLKNISYTIVSIFFVLCIQFSVKSQIDAEQRIKRQSHTGFILGGYIQNPSLEIGIGQILIDKPCNKSRHHDFGPACSFPKKLEIDATFEYSFLKKDLYAQKITLLYTLLAWQDNKNRYKSLYYSVGHLLFGISMVNYTNFKANRIFWRPEISWMAPQRIALHKKHSTNDQWQLNLRLIYGYNKGKASIEYPIPQHQFGIQMMFLHTRK